MRNIIITGGGLVNKGAQAMTLIAADQLRRRFPEHRILLLSAMDQQRPEAEKQQYTFGFTGWYPLKFARAQKNPLLRALCLLRSRQELLECEAIYKNTDLLVDISGYALGSNWSEKICNDFLDPLDFARAFGIPVYVLPQSFGPFDFADPAIDRRCRQLLPTAKLICAREQEGYDALVSTYGLQNVIRTPDLVLSSKALDLGNVYTRVPAMDLPPLAEKSVGIIPNQRNFDIGSHQEVLDFYRAAMERILAGGNRIYILSHSDMDKPVCRELKALYADDERVVLLDREFSCVEFNELVKGFRYLVASRFHSIVHAYKNGVPCIVLGWAVKYRDLLAQFGQSRYGFDVRKPSDRAQLLTALEQMEDAAEDEARTILNALAQVQQENIFDLIQI